MIDVQASPADMQHGISIISVHERDRWIAEHRQGGLPSNSWDYAWGLSASGVEPRLAVVTCDGSRLLMAFFQREFMGSTDIATIFGASGALVVPLSRAPLSLWREYATSKGWVAGYIQLSSLMQLTPETGDEDLVDSNAVLWLETGNATIDRFSATVRDKINRATAVKTILVDDPAILGEHLIRLYPLTLRRLGAHRRYHFSPQTLVRWANAPGSLILGAQIEGAIEAVSLFLLAGQQAEYHLNASTERGRELAAWLIWHAIQKLQAAGAAHLNLGGGVRPGDGLYQFKRRFNATARPLQSIRQIYDPSRYAQLCASVRVSPVAGDWFPAYWANQDLIAYRG